MASTISLPSVGQNELIRIAYNPDARYTLPFDLGAARVIRDGNDLCLLLDNDATGLVLTDFFLHSWHTGSLVTGEEVIALKDLASIVQEPDAEPAMGPEQASQEPAKLDPKTNDSRFHDYETGDLAGGIDHLWGLDYQQQVGPAEAVSTSQSVGISGNSDAAFVSGGEMTTIAESFIPPDPPAPPVAQGEHSFALNESDISGDVTASGMAQAKLFSGELPFTGMVFSKGIADSLIIDGVNDDWEAVISPESDSLVIRLENGGEIHIAIDGFDPSGTAVFSFSLDKAANHITDDIVISGVSVDGIARDGSRAVNSNVSLTIRDDAPIGQDAFRVLEEGGSALSGDISLIASSGADGWRSEDGEITAFELVGENSGTYGTFTLNADGSYTYERNASGIPPKGGSDTFIYRAYDADGDWTEHTVTIEVTPSLPKATSGSVALALSDTGTMDDSGSEKLFDGLAEFTTAVFDASGLQNITVDGNSGYRWVLSPDGKTIGGYDDKGNTVTFSIESISADGHVALSTTMDGPARHENTDNIRISGISVTAFDRDGGTAVNSNVTLDISDDKPSGVDDFAQMMETAPNVTGEIAGNDDAGADGWRSDAAGNVNAFVIVGEGKGDYGSISLSPDGRYVYTRNDVEVPLSGGVETFTYRAYDADGDWTEQTLTIYIQSNKGVSLMPEIPVIQDADVPDIPLNAEHPLHKPEDALQSEAEVREYDLVPETGLSRAANVVSSDGAILVSAPDGLKELFVGDECVFRDGVFTEKTISTHEGRLVVTGYDGEKLTYTFVLERATTEHEKQGSDVISHSFAVRGVDVNGMEGSTFIAVKIVDDVVRAELDSDAVVDSDDPSVLEASGNVLGNDRFGADGFGSFTWLDTATKYGTLVANPDGSYIYTLNAEHRDVKALIDGETLTETFSYRVTDADGDMAESTLTITIKGKDDGVTVTPGNPVEPDPDVPGKGPENVDPGTLVSSLTVRESELELDDAGNVISQVRASDAVMINAPDGLSSIEISGVHIWDSENGLAANPVVGTDEGRLVVTSYENGKLSYEFILERGTTEHERQGEDAIRHDFAIHAVDRNGSSGVCHISVSIVDALPNAVADTAFADEGQTDPVTGNVLDNDSFGADGRNAESFVRLLDGEEARYGSIEFGEDGSYSYTLDNSLAEVKALSSGETLRETFRYEIMDADGDTHEAELAITIRGADNGITVTPENPVVPDPDVPGKGPDDLEPGVQVSEITVREQDIASGNATEQGTIVIDAPDGAKEVSLSGVLVWTAENGIVEGNEVRTADGVLTATGFDAATGRLTYEYTLTGASHEHSAQGADAIVHTFKVSVKDMDDTEQHGFVSVKIIDDTPGGVSDDAFVSEGASEAVTGNVLDNDGFGADGRHADSFVRLLNGNEARYGSIEFGEDGFYSYTLNNSLEEIRALTSGETLRETFRYEIRDADGDTHEAELRITINGVDNGITVIPENPVDPNPDVPGKGPDDLEPGVQVSEITVREQDIASGNAAGQGTTIIDAPDGAKEISISGVLIWTAENGIVEGNSISTADGVLTATGFDPATGRLTYEYTLTNASHEHSAQGNDAIVHTFKLSVKDMDGTEQHGFLSVKVVDDTPNPVDDDVSISEGASDALVGSVLGNDSFGADGRNAESFVRLLNGEEARYGSIRFGENGSYSYTLDNSLAEVKALSTGETLLETFRYEIRDADGDVREAELRITINGVDNGVTVTPENPVNPDPDVPGKGPDDLEPGVQVSEIIVREQDIASGNAIGRGAVNISAPDGAKEISISGVLVWTAENGIVEGNEIRTDDGVLTASGFDPATGKLVYEYTLENPSHEHSAQGADAIAHIFKVSVKDMDDTEQHGFVSVKIVDAVPNAVNDEAFVNEGSEPFTGTVLDNDDFGADGRNADIFVRLLNPENGKYGTIMFNDDGSYNYMLDNSLAEVKALTTGEKLHDTFRYEIRDADGDVHEATLTITIRGVDNGITVTPENPVDPDPDVPGKGPDDLEPGVQVSEITVREQDIASDNANGTGSLVIDAPDGAKEISISGVLVWTAENGIVEGNEVRTADGILTATGFDSTTGKLVCQYALTNASNEHSAQGADAISHTFKVSVKDMDDTERHGFISVKVVDDMPGAVNDEAFADEGRAEPVSGNVLDNDGFGADGRHSETFVRLLDTGNARYGSIVFDDDGSYSYTLDNSLDEVRALTDGESLSDVFRYEIQDADGDVHEATLTITIRGVDNGITVTPENPVDPDPDVPGKGPDDLDSGIQVSEVVVNEQLLGGEAPAG